MWGELFMNLGFAAVGSLIGWLTARHYYNRSSADMTGALRRHAADAERRDTLEYFEHMLEHSRWTEERIAERSVWVCEQRSTFTIVRKGDYRDFDEEWTKRVPDQEHNAMSTVELRINNSPVRELTFVSLDGGRYFLPLPDKSVERGRPVYSWFRESLEFKVGKIIGSYYRFDNIEDTAKFLGVGVFGGKPNER